MFQHNLRKMHLHHASCKVFVTEHRNIFVELPHVVYSINFSDVAQMMKVSFNIVVILNAIAIVIINFDVVQGHSNHEVSTLVLK